VKLKTNSSQKCTAKGEEAMGTRCDTGKSEKRTKEKYFYNEWLNTATGCSDSKIFGKTRFCLTKLTAKK